MVLHVNNPRPSPPVHDPGSPAAWRSFADISATFGQTDQLKLGSGQTVCVFDVGGNTFRLVAFISYAKGKVYVLRVMSQPAHAGCYRWSLRALGT